MNILIIGGSGFIGYHLKQYLKEFYTVFSTYNTHKIVDSNSFQINLHNFNSIEKIFSKVNPDVVIHTAAITNVDFCEKNKNLSMNTNFYGTKNIVKLSKEYKNKIIFISTPFVYDGTLAKYNEEDVNFNPRTYYGITKQKSEELVSNSNLSKLILRIDQPYFWKTNWHHTNSVLRVIETLSKNDVIREVVDWKNNPTYVPDFLEATKQLIDQKINGSFNLTGNDFISRFEWAKITAKIFQLNEKLILPIYSNELKLDVKRPNIRLENEKIFNKIGVKMRGVEEGMLDMRSKKSEFQ